MLDMRMVHASGSEDRQLARRRMALLSRRFPGSLREIDDLELSELTRRVARLDGVLAGAGEEEPWMEAVALFHEFARGALAVKRWLEGRRPANAALERAFTAAIGSMSLPKEAEAWSEDLAAIAMPPQGRVVELVFERVARTLGTSKAEARVLVFGAHRRPAPPRRR
jgi:hypothetical protein